MRGVIMTRKPSGRLVVSREKHKTVSYQSQVQSDVEQDPYVQTNGISRCHELRGGKP